jgi:hypothetical protein
MPNPIRFFDYIYYRIVWFFLDRDLPVQDTGWANLALLQTLTVLDLWIIAGFFCQAGFLQDGFPIWIIPVLMVLGGLNWWRYTRSLGMRNLLSIWRGENKKQKFLNGLAIIIYMIASVLIALSWGIMKSLEAGINF